MTFFKIGITERHLFLKTIIALDSSVNYDLCDPYVVKSGLFDLSEFMSIYERMYLFLQNISPCVALLALSVLLLVCIIGILCHIESSYVCYVDRYYASMRRPIFFLVEALLFYIMQTSITRHLDIQGTKSLPVDVGGL